MKKLYTLLSAIFFCAASYAQIPNSGFESWDSSAGYKVPVGWDNVNYMTDFDSVYTCEPQSPGYSGDYCLRLMSKPVTGLGIVPGVAVCGKMDSVTHLPIHGFPFSSRPQILTGYWQYMAFSTSDQGFIAVLLTKWNTTTLARDTVAYTKHNLFDMKMFWEQFTIPLNYLSTATPDSALIVLSSSGATLAPVAANSYLWVDDLRLSDSMTLSVNHPVTYHSEISVFPNPASDQANVSFYSTSEKNINICVTDLSGRKISEANTVAISGENSFPVNISGYAPGLYLIRLTDAYATQVKKLIIE